MHPTDIMHRNSLTLDGPTMLTGPNMVSLSLAFQACFLSLSLCFHVFRIAGWQVVDSACYSDESAARHVRFACCR